MGKRFLEVTIVLENSRLKEELGLNEENCLTDSKAFIDLNRVESVRESFDSAGNSEEGLCYIQLFSGGEHCVRLTFERMKYYLENV